MERDLFLYGGVTFCGKTFSLDVFGEYLVILLLLTVNAFLDYLNNLQIDQHSWVTLSFWPTLFHTFCLLQQTLFRKRNEYCVLCLGLLQVTSFSMNLLHECTYYRILRDEVLLHNRGWSGLVRLWLGVLLHFAITECDYWEQLTSQLSS